jgi:hypothetical protein
MTQGKRSSPSPAQKTDVWNRWKAGQMLHEKLLQKPLEALPNLFFLALPPAEQMLSLAVHPAQKISLEIFELEASRSDR